MGVDGTQEDMDLKDTTSGVANDVTSSVSKNSYLKEVRLDDVTEEKIDFHDVSSVANDPLSFRPFIRLQSDDPELTCVGQSENGDFAEEPPLGGWPPATSELVKIINPEDSEKELQAGVELKGTSRQTVTHENCSMKNKKKIPMRHQCCILWCKQSSKTDQICLHAPPRDPNRCVIIVFLIFIYET